jgi:hypothetical protein
MKKALVIASVLMAAALTGIFSTNPMAAYAEDDYDGDSSETNTEQKIKIDANGSGESDIHFCVDNDINSPDNSVDLSTGGTCSDSETVVSIP